MKFLLIVHLFMQKYIFDHYELIAALLPVLVSVATGRASLMTSL